MLLGLDLGTTNVKALLVGEDGAVIGRGAIPVDVTHLPDGGAEQDIEQIWQAVLRAIAQAGTENHLRGVRAVGVSSQGGAIQVRTRDGHCVGPVISWMDTRGRRFDEELTQRLGADWFAARVGHPGSAVAVGQILRLRELNPDLLGPGHCIGFVGDTIVQRFTGRAAHDPSSLSICTLYNPSQHKADPELLETIGLDETQLPDLVAAVEPAGTLTHQVADRIGLPAGIPVSAAVHDQYAAAIGCGALAPGDIMFGAGTAWVLLAVSDHPTTPISPQAWVCDHLVTGRWGQLVSLIAGGSVFRWALEMTGWAEAPAEKIDALLASVPAGCDGLYVFPFHDGMGGPRRLHAGRVQGLRLMHGPAHLLRGCVEGLCFELARQLEWLREAGCAASRLVMCGAAAASRCTPQIVADVTGRRVDCPEQPEVSAFGAAVLARVLAEPGIPLEEAARSLAGPVRSFEPGPARADYAERLGGYIEAVEHEI